MVGLSGISMNVYEKWTIVPNLTGRTYDDAMRIIYDCRLKGQLALAGTNSNLTNSDSRVVWQSCRDGVPQKVDATISFILDDCFSLNRTPLNQYVYKDWEIDTVPKLNYRCDYKDAIQQAAEQEREALENDTAVEYIISDPHWNIEVNSADLKYEAYTSTHQGTLYTTVNVGYSYKVYGKAMAALLKELVTDSALNLSGIAMRPDLDECTIVGKLIPISGQGETDLSGLHFPDSLGQDNSMVFLPQTIMSGEYVFSFSIIDKDDQLFEWYHYVTVVDND